MGLVFYGTMIPTYMFAANLRLPKKNIMLGVTIPYARHDEPSVTAVGITYLRRIRILTVVAGILGLPILLVPFMSIQLLIMLTLLLLFITGDFVIFVRANRALAAIKRQSNWAESAHTVPAVADFRAMEEKRRPLPRLFFILPCLIAAIPLIPLIHEMLTGTVEWGQAAGYLITVLFVPLLLILGEAIRRQGAEVVGTDSDLNVILTRVRRREYLRCMALCAWLLALTALAVGFQTIMLAFWFPAVVLTLAIVVAAYSFRAEFAVRRTQEKFTKMAGYTLAVDDDAYWLWGFFYHNRNDRRLLIKDRVGMSMGMNLGRPLGLCLMLLSGLLLLAMPLIGVWSVAQEFTPITYHVEGTEVTATQIRSRTFDLGTDFEAEIVDALPHGSRTFGTAIGTLRAGTFSFDGIGSAYALFHTDQPPFIVLTTSDGQVLVFNFDPVFEPLLR